MKPYKVVKRLAVQVGIRRRAGLANPALPLVGKPPRDISWIRLPHEGDRFLLPKSFLGEGSSRTGFEVVFEC